MIPQNLIKSTTSTAPYFTILDFLSATYPIDSIRYIKIQNLSFPVLCPDCHCEMKILNSSRRKPKNSSGQQIPFNLRKFGCSQCNRTHLEIPDFLQPHKQYERAVIQKALEGDYSEFGMDEGTVRYWKGIKKP